METPSMVAVGIAEAEADELDTRMESPPSSEVNRCRDAARRALCVDSYVLMPLLRLRFVLSRRLVRVVYYGTILPS